MNTTGQVQIRVSVSQQLGGLLRTKAQSLGIPLTQFIKHLLITEVKKDKEEYPIYQMSARAEKVAKKAMEDYKNGKAIEVDNISEFFKSL